MDAKSLDEFYLMKIVDVDGNGGKISSLCEVWGNIGSQEPHIIGPDIYLVGFRNRIFSMKKTDNA